MWKTFIFERGGSVKNEFPLSTLAHISSGYSAGSIKKTVENVLTEFRKSKMEQRPLTLAEFIGPLSMCINTMDDQYDDWKTLSDNLTGDEARRKVINAALAGDDAGADPKKGKKAPKKKKK
jgi:predicted secreted protein